jgi:hypothetical protein
MSETDNVQIGRLGEKDMCISTRKPDDAMGEREKGMISKTNARVGRDAIEGLDQTCQFALAPSIPFASLPYPIVSAGHLELA